MAYIAIKNTEHKGVYKEKGFNKEIYKTKGISYRKFKVEELKEALKWAGVKNIKDTNIVSNEKVSTYKNTALEAILAYKSKGFEGVCITTKSFGDIFLKINKVDIFICGELKRFNRDRDSLVEHLKIAFEDAKVEKEKYSYTTPYPFNVKFEIVRFENLSKIDSINADYLNISNFWIKIKSNSPFDKKELLISNTIQLNNNTSDFLTSYNNFAISNHEIISIQPLEFLLPRNTSGVGSCFDGFYDYKYIFKKITASESKKIEQLFTDAEAQNLTITKLK